MLVNRIGRKAPTSVSYLLPSKNKCEATSLVLDTNRDLRAGANEPELVLYKQQENQDWAWEKVADIQELQNFMKTASTEEKQNHLGTWKDSKRLWIFPGNGSVESHEVTPMKKRWSELKLSKSETEYDREHGHDGAHYSYFSEVSPHKVAVKEKKLATGQVWTLEEPRKYVETEVERVVEWKITSDGFRPAEYETRIYDAESYKDMRTTKG